jgi:hypothetical protein
VLKPSEHAARTGAALVAALSEALPEGLIGLVQGGAPAGMALVAEVDQVVFVGGVAGGRAVARAAAERLIPAQIEPPTQRAPRSPGHPTTRPLSGPLSGSQAPSGSSRGRAAPSSTPSAGAAPRSGSEATTAWST